MQVRCSTSGSPHTGERLLQYDDHHHAGKRWRELGPRLQFSAGWETHLGFSGLQLVSYRIKKEGCHKTIQIFTSYHCVQQSILLNYWRRYRTVHTLSLLEVKIEEPQCSDNSCRMKQNIAQNRTVLYLICRSQVDPMVKIESSRPMSIHKTIIVGHNNVQTACTMYPYLSSTPAWCDWTWSACPVLLTHTY